MVKQKKKIIPISLRACMRRPGSIFALARASFLIILPLPLLCGVGVGIRVGVGVRVRVRVWV